MSPSDSQTLTLKAPPQCSSDITFRPTLTEFNIDESRMSLCTEDTSAISISSIASKTFNSSTVFANQPYEAKFRSAPTGTNSNEQLRKIVSGTCEALTATQLARDHCRGVIFTPKTCTWTSLLVLEGDVVEEDLVGGDPSSAGCYWCTVVIKQEEGYGSAPGKFCSSFGKYVVEMFLIPPAPGVKVTEKAKIEKIFMTLSFAVKKAVVKSDFPIFPEGNSGKTFREVYQLNAEIKAGAFAKVMQGTHRASGQKVAAKCVFRDKLTPQDDAAIFDEVAIMASTVHPHIVALIDFFEEADWYIIVMELVTGGDLFDRIGAKKAYSEKDARDLSRVLLDSMVFIHESGIAHCDMKPKNLVLMDSNEDSHVKVTDFGFASRVFTPNSLTRQCGTPLFVAPEVLKKIPYDQAADMWSVGVIIYLLLGGTLPFLAANLKSLFQKIVLGKYEFNDKYWGNVSDEAKSFINQLLVVDPAERMTAREALNHRWIRQMNARSLMMNDLSASKRELKVFNAKMKLRAAMLAVNWATTGFGIAKKRIESENNAEEKEETINEE